ncbi:MAG: ABC transporter permease [Candidatus Cloacimonetes bacterium]|nr:ABC transporter permease [Candidatus Cloacimonadota bacterium]
MYGHGWIALRFLRQRSRLPLAMVHLLSLAGIALGVFAILVVSSVMNGFDNYMVDRVTGMRAHIWVERADGSPTLAWRSLCARIENDNDVLVASPVAAVELMIQEGENIAPVTLLGVDIARHARATALLDSMLIGSPDAGDIEEGGIILGWELSYALGAVTVGEYVTLSSVAAMQPTPFGPVPRTKQLRVAGVVQSGLPDYNRTLAFTNLRTAQMLAGLPDAVDRIEVRTVDAFSSRHTAQRLSQLLGPDYRIRNWSEFEANLFQAIHLEKAVMFLVLCLMFVIVGFNISGSFLKMAAEKSRDIGVLRACGSTRRYIGGLFVRAALILGLSGTLTGLAAALALTLSQMQAAWIKVPVRGLPMRTLPMQLRLTDVITVCAVAMFVSLLASLYPAMKAHRMQPVELLRDP